MKFLCRKDYSGKNLLGEDIVIKAGEPLETQGEILVYDKRPLFHIHSQNARNYMIWNDDDFGIQRTIYEDIILFSKNTYVEGYLRNFKDYKMDTFGNAIYQG